MGDFQLRSAGAEDLAAVAALVRRAEAHDGVPRVLADEELVQDLGAPHVQLDADTRVALRAGEAVGWAYVWNPPARERLDRAELFGEVAPEHRDTGVGRALLGWSVARARERLAARAHDLPRFIRVDAYDWLEDRHRLYGRFGFDAVRFRDELVRPLGDLPTVPVPGGVTVVSWPDDRDHEIREARNAAFADHWGSTVVGAEQWHDFVRGHGARPDLSAVALDEATGRVIGLCANQAYPEDEAVTGRRDAWIAVLGTVPAARGRGVASALIAWSLGAFAGAGFSHAVLEVDTENPTGAARLYRGLGFEPLHRSITHEIQVTACQGRGRVGCTRGCCASYRDGVIDPGLPDWRLLLSHIHARFRAPSFPEAAAFVLQVAGAVEAEVDLRPSGVVQVGLPLDGIDDARTISALASEAGLVAEPLTVAVTEVAIDAMDIAAVRPFWRAALGYVDDGDNALADPERIGPPFWFQQMDEPRPQRNRIHIDVTVPHDVAEGRVEAALAAGGSLVTDRWAKSFWVLADPEGNEACICTWQDRD